MKANTFKKLMALALGAMMTLSLLTGCGSSKTEAPADNADTTAPAEETPAADAPEGWHFVTAEELSALPLPTAVAKARKLAMDRLTQKETKQN